MQPAPLLRALTLFFCGAALTSCGTTIYTRAPAPCPNDPYCIAAGDDSGRENPDPERVREFVRRNVEATVVVRAFRRSGGTMKTAVGVGALLGRRGLVLTSHSAVTEAELVTVAFQRMAADGTISEYGEMPMMPVITSWERGVSVLVPKGEGYHPPPPMPVIREPMVKGDSFWHFGRDGTWGRDTVIDDRVSFGYKRDFVMIATKATNADSGAPIVDSCGNVIGILTYVDDKKRQGLVIPVIDAFPALGIADSDLR
jgi:S1-C subfamily serine protease